jgi:hypothetical protein
METKMTTTNETEKPDMLTRIAAIWRKPKEDALATYARLLKRRELDGKTLSDREEIELSEAMQVAGITLVKYKEHREICEQILINRPVAAGLAQAQAQFDKAVSDIDKLKAEIAAMDKRLAPLAKPYNDADNELKRAQNAQGAIFRCTAKLAEIGVIL